jgi:excisionase family DNA binding protein
MTNLITTSEAASMLGLKPARVRQLAQRGELPGQRKGQDWIFKPDDVVSFKRRPVGRPPGRVGKMRKFYALKKW